MGTATTKKPAGDVIDPLDDPIVAADEFDLTDHQAIATAKQDAMATALDICQNAKWPESLKTLKGILLGHRVVQQVEPIVRAALSKKTARAKMQRFTVSPLSLTSAQMKRLFITAGIQTLYGFVDLDAMSKAADAKALEAVEANDTWWLADRPKVLEKVKANDRMFGAARDSARQDVERILKHQAALAKWSGTNPLEDNEDQIPPPPPPRARQTPPEPGRSLYAPDIARNRPRRRRPDADRPDRFVGNFSGADPRAADFPGDDS